MLSHYGEEAEASEVFHAWVAALENEGRQQSPSMRSKGLVKRTSEQDLSRRLPLVDIGAPAISDNAESDGAANTNNMRGQ